MELYDLKFRGAKIDVFVIDDYKVDGTFDPKSPSDIDYYGYRETVFEIESLYSEVERAGYRIFLPESKEVTDEFFKHFESEITLLVQNAIDEKLGDTQ